MKNKKVDVLTFDQWFAKEFMRLEHLDIKSLMAWAWSAGIEQAAWELEDPKNKDWKPGDQIRDLKHSCGAHWEYAFGGRRSDRPRKFLAFRGDSLKELVTIAKLMVPGGEIWREGDLPPGAHISQAAGSELAPLEAEKGHIVFVELPQDWRRPARGPRADAPVTLQTERYNHYDPRKDPTLGEPETSLSAQDRAEALAMLDTEEGRLRLGEEIGGAIRAAREANWTTSKIPRQLNLLPDREIPHEPPAGQVRGGAFDAMVDRGQGHDRQGRVRERHVPEEVSTWILTHLAEKTTRVAGDVICELCHRPFRDHPEISPTFVLLCYGTIGKT